MYFKFTLFSRQCIMYIYIYIYVYIYIYIYMNIYIYISLDREFWVGIWTSAKAVFCFKYSQVNFRANQGKGLTIRHSEVYTM